jgi:hypothetical protein
MRLWAPEEQRHGYSNAQTSHFYCTAQTSGFYCTAQHKIKRADWILDTLVRHVPHFTWPWLRRSYKCVVFTFRMLQVCEQSWKPSSNLQHFTSVTFIYLIHKQVVWNILNYNSTCVLCDISRVVAGIKQYTVTNACRKRRLKLVPSAWGYSWSTLSPGVINTEACSSRLRVGRWSNNPAP